MIQSNQSLLASCVHTFRFSWKSMAVTDIVYKTIGFVILTPLIGLLFKLFLTFSGKSVLADMDILIFFLKPIGWLALLVVGSVWITIFALELTALMVIADSAAQNEHVQARSALRFAARYIWPVLQVTARIVARILGVATPFLAVAGGIYILLLTRFDINYYLTERPPIFWITIGIIGCTLALMMVVLVWMLIRWVFSLPLMLFEDVGASNALCTSRHRTNGHHKTIFLWIFGWFVSTAFMSLAVTGIVEMLGRFIVPTATNSLTLLIIIVGAILLLFIAANLILSLLSATTLSIVLVILYGKLGRSKSAHRPRLVAEELVGSGSSFLLSRRRLLFGSGIAILIAAFIGDAAFSSVRLDDTTQIMAHRGASGSAPENTLAAVEKAIEDGADWVEIDVQESADGVVVVVHDSDLKKVAGVDLKIWEATAEEIRAVDVGRRFGSGFSGERVPTLEEVLVACKGRVRLNIELKYYGHDDRLEQRVVELVEKHAMQSDVVIMSLKYDKIQKIRSLRPKWKVGLLSAVAVGNLTQLDADFLAVSLSLATRRFIRNAHKSDKDVYVWTVNDPMTMSAMMGRGVDSIITDEPALARSVLKQRASLSPAERLLVELAVLFGVTIEKKLTIEDV